MSLGTIMASMVVQINIIKKKMEFDLNRNEVNIKKGKVKRM